MSKIVCLRTVRIAERPNLIWLELETDDGLVGLGESFRGAQATEAVIHEQVAPWLIGRDARWIEAVSRHLMTPYLGFHSAGAEPWPICGDNHACRSAAARRWAASCPSATSWRRTRWISSCSILPGAVD